MLKNTIIIWVMQIIAKIASFLSETVLAAVLGNSKSADLYYLVIGIQNVLYPMISVGIWKVFMPAYKTEMLTSKEAANRSANQLILLFVGLSIILVAVLMIIPETIIRLFAPGFSVEQRIEAGSLLMISAPMYLFATIATFQSSILQANNRYLVSQIKEVIIYIPTIIAAFTFFPIYGIKSLAIALMIGTVLQFVIQYFFIRDIFKFRIEKKHLNEKNQSLIGKVPLVCFSNAITQIYGMIDRVVASMLPVGSLSCLNYGNKLLNAVNSIFLAPINVAIYPYIIKYVAENDKEKLTDLINKVVVAILIITVPLELGMLLYSKEIVTIAFARGIFSFEAVDLTSEIFFCYALSLVLIPINIITNDIFYIQGEVKYILKVNIINTVTNIILSIGLSFVMGAAGIALATTISILICVVIKFLRLRFVLLFRSYYLIEIFKVVISGIVSTAFIWFLINLFSIDELHLKMLFAVCATVALYFMILKALHVVVLNELLKMVGNKILNRK